MTSAFGWEAVTGLCSAPLVIVVISPWISCSLLTGLEHPVVVVPAAEDSSISFESKLT